MKPFMALGALALMAACGAQSDLQTDPSTSVVGDTTFFRLPIGTTGAVGDLSIQFTAVDEDSRCPAGVQCVWEGNAELRLTLTDGTGSVVARVNSAVEPRVIDASGYSISYRDLSPHPVSDQPFDSSDYAAELAVAPTP